MGFNTIAGAHHRAEAEESNTPLFGSQERLNMAFKSKKTGRESKSGCMPPPKRYT
jgi:hypothetical protein